MKQYAEPDNSSVEVYDKLIEDALEEVGQEIAKEEGWDAKPMNVHDKKSVDER